MTPQEHLAEAEAHLRQASAWQGHPTPSDVHQVQLALAHAEVGMLAQAVQDSENMGQLNATAQAARTEILRRTQERG